MLLLGKNALKSIPVTVDEDASSIFVKFQEILVCGVFVNESDYDIFKVSSAWAKETSYRCRKSENGDGTWHYYVDTADEVIGEVKRLFMFESKNSKKSLLSFEERVKKAGLQFESGWSDDPRSKFETVLKPLIENTEYYFKYNETDSTKHILEICKGGEKGQVVGFQKKAKRSQ